MPWPWWLFVLSPSVMYLAYALYAAIDVRLGLERVPHGGGLMRALMLPMVACPVVVMIAALHVTRFRTHTSTRIEGMMDWCQRLVFMNLCATCLVVMLHLALQAWVL